MRFWALSYVVLNQTQIWCFWGFFLSVNRHVTRIRIQCDCPATLDQRSSYLCADWNHKQKQTLRLKVDRVPGWTCFPEATHVTTPSLRVLTPHPHHKDPELQRTLFILLLSTISFYICLLPLHGHLNLKLYTLTSSSVCLLPDRALRSICSDIHTGHFRAVTWSHWSRTLKHSLNR